MQVCLFEDPQVDQFEPMTLTRPVFDLRCGVNTLGQRLVESFRAPLAALFVRDSIAEVSRELHPKTPTNIIAALPNNPTLFVNGRWLPPENFVPPNRCEPHVAVNGETVVYALVNPEHRERIESLGLAEALRAFQHSFPADEAGGQLLQYPWELVEHNEDLLRQDFQAVLNAKERVAPSNFTVVGDSNMLHVSPSAKVEPMVVFNTDGGPVIVDEEAVITAFSRIEGPCYVGPRTQIVGAKIRGGSTFGPQCRVGGEVEASILHGYSNKYHDGFLGHAYVGEWVNLGAGTSNSDLRNDYGEVRVIIQGVPVGTGSNKVGCFVGDHTKSGLGSLINTGSTFGAFTNVLPAGNLAPKYIPSFCTLWKGELRENQDFDGLMQVAETVMKRRGQRLMPAHRNLYQRLFEDTATLRERALEDMKKRNVFRSA